MIINRYNKEGFDAASLDVGDTSDIPIAVIAHGGATLNWNDRAPVTKLLFQHVPIIHSLLLPWHGRNNNNLEYNDGNFDLISAVVDEIRELLAHIVKARRVIFIGMSMGGLILIKTFSSLYHSMQPTSICIGIGTALTLGSSGKLVEMYWRAILEDLENSPDLSKVHSDPRSMLKFIIDGAANPISPLYHNQKQLELLKISDAFKRIFFVHGSHDSAFPLSELKEIVNQKNIRVIADLDHFDYMKRENWRNVERALNEIIQQNFSSKKRARL